MMGHLNIDHLTVLPFLSAIAALYGLMLVGLSISRSVNNEFQEVLLSFLKLNLALESL